MPWRAGEKGAAPGCGAGAPNAAKPATLPAAGGAACTGGVGDPPSAMRIESLRSSRADFAGEAEGGELGPETGGGGRGGGPPPPGAGAGGAPNRSRGSDMNGLGTPAAACAYSFNNSVSAQHQSSS